MLEAVAVSSDPVSAFAGGGNVGNGNGGGNGHGGRNGGGNGGGSIPAGAGSVISQGAEFHSVSGVDALVSGLEVVELPRVGLFALVLENLVVSLTVRSSGPLFDEAFGSSLVGVVVVRRAAVVRIGVLASSSTGSARAADQIDHGESLVGSLVEHVLEVRMFRSLGGAVDGGADGEASDNGSGLVRQSKFRRASVVVESGASGGSTVEFAVVSKVLQLSEVSRGNHSHGNGVTVDQGEIVKIGSASGSQSHLSDGVRGLSSVGWVTLGSVVTGFELTRTHVALSSQAFEFSIDLFAVGSRPEPSSNQIISHVHGSRGFWSHEETSFSRSRETLGSDPNGIRAFVLELEVPRFREDDESGQEEDQM